jgi:Mn2+/Fe2+ NRAMP family transporter
MVAAHVHSQFISNILAVYNMYILPGLVCAMIADHAHRLLLETCQVLLVLLLPPPAYDHTGSTYI